MLHILIAKCYILRICFDFIASLLRVQLFAVTFFFVVLTPQNNFKDKMFIFNFVETEVPFSEGLDIHLDRGA